MVKLKRGQSVFVEGKKRGGGDGNIFQRKIAGFPGHLENFDRSLISSGPFSTSVNVQDNNVHQ